MSSAPRLLPSSLNWTPATATLSEALADTVTVPETDAPFAGAVTDAAGGVVFRHGDGNRRRRPAVAGCVPGDRRQHVRPGAAVLVSQEAESGAVMSSAPRLAPSSLNWTPATARCPRRTP